MPTAAMIREAIDEFGNVPASMSRHQPQPAGQARGLYRADESYRAMDVAAFNGSEWRAIKDDPRPLPGPGWMLGAKGARGRPGEPGKPGVHVKAMDVVGYTLVLTLSDGQTLRASMLPALERFERERKAGK